jgi:hypothetical protein
MILAGIQTLSSHLIPAANEANVSSFCLQDGNSKIQFDQ